jgi:hypothetical protein
LYGATNAQFPPRFPHALVDGFSGGRVARYTLIGAAIDDGREAADALDGGLERQTGVGDEQNARLTAVASLQLMEQQRGV